MPRRAGAQQPTVRFDSPFDANWRPGPRPGQPATPGVRPGASAGAGQPQMPSFDFSGALTGDPLYQQMLADLTAQSVSDRAGLAAARKRAVINFGEVPDFASLDQGLIGQGFADDIDETTRQLAAKNTQEGLSVAARIQKAHKDQVRQLRNALAARGLLSSGETGHQLSEAQQGLKQSQYDAREQLLGFLSQYQQGYMEGERQRQLAQQQGLSGAYERALALFLSQLGAGGFGGPGGPPQLNPMQTAAGYIPMPTPGGDALASWGAGKPQRRYHTPSTGQKFRPI